VEDAHAADSRLSHLRVAGGGAQATDPVRSERPRLAASCWPIFLLRSSRASTPRFAAAGLDVDKPVITYCNAGISAALGALVLNELDNRGVAELVFVFCCLYISVASVALCLC
jgi:rhodanese-related sulfurtransferase